MKASSQPFCKQALYTAMVPGMMMPRTPGAMVLPFKIS